MATTVLSAHLPKRELAIAAFEAGMVDATRTEIVKYSILRLAGYSHDDAKKLALSHRTTVEYSDDNQKVSVRMPEEWVEIAMAKYPEFSKSTLFRYSLIRLTSDHAESIRYATRKRGRKSSQKEEEAA